MGKTVEIFNRLVAMHDDRKKEIAQIFENYRSEVARIETRYSKQVADEKLGALVSASRAEIERAHERAGERAQIAIDELRDELRKHVLMPPDSALLAQLSAAHGFGLELSRGEIEAFADSARGNYTALRCIQKIAERSGFRLDFVGVDALEKDLAAVERAFQPSCWCPQNFAAEGLKVLPNVRFRGIDYGRPSSTQLATAFAASQAARANLEEGRARWSRIGDPLAQKSEYTLEKFPSQAPQNAL